MLRNRINAPTVVSEVIDGEAVIMNLDSGDYFSARGTAAVVWEWLIAGHTPDDITGVLAELWPATSATDDVERFLAELRKHKLVAEASADVRPDAPPAASDELRALAKQPYKAPALEVFSDMQDMLLLDPIHDVGEQGWPMPAPTDEPAG